jgi:alkylation response protein AidB-like acyl-CoA dehydrogenase
MYFPLTDAEIRVREMVRDFVEKEVRPGAAERDRDSRFPYELWRRISELGLTGIPFPEEYGGSAAGWMSFILAVEEISRVDPSLAATYMVSTNVAGILNEAGTHEQKMRWMVPLVQGTHIGAFGLTEPHGGSDNRAMRTTARLENGEWVINGSKAFITNSGTDISLFVIVFCVTGQREDGRKEYSAIIVPLNSRGLTVLPAYRKLGWHSSDTHPLVFEDCRVPAENLLGERGQGLRLALGMLTFGRVVIAASALGLAQGCLEECLRYAHDRHAFGRPIGSFQGMRFTLADMATEVEAARLMVYQATRAFEAGKLTRRDASMVKLFVTEMAQRVAVTACDFFGGMGFMDEMPVARFYRDVKVMTIGDGTANIQRYIIAKDLNLPPEP